MVRSASASSSGIGLVPLDPVAASTTSSGCDGNRAVPSIIAPAETAGTSDSSVGTILQQSAVSSVPGEPPLSGGLSGADDEHADEITIRSERR